MRYCYCSTEGQIGNPGTSDTGTIATPKLRQAAEAPPVAERYCDNCPCIQETGY